MAGGELDTRVGLGAELGVKGGEIEAQSVGWKGHVWWSDRGVSSTEFRGADFDQAGGESRRAVRLNPARCQDGSVGRRNRCSWWENVG